MAMTISLSTVTVFTFAVITMAIFALHGTVTVLLSCKRATVHWSQQNHDTKKNVNDDEAHDCCKNVSISTIGLEQEITVQDTFRFWPLKKITFFQGQIIFIQTPKFLNF